MSEKKQDPVFPHHGNFASVPVFGSDKVNVKQLIKSLGIDEEMKSKGVTHMILGGTQESLRLANMLYPGHSFSGADELIVFFLGRFGEQEEDDDMLAVSAIVFRLNETLQKSRIHEVVP